MRKVVLDTNIVSYFLRGNAEVVDRLSQYSQFYDAVTFSLLTYYEIKNRGIRNSVRADRFTDCYDPRNLRISAGDRNG